MVDESTGMPGEGYALAGATLLDSAASNTVNYLIAKGNQEQQQAALDWQKYAQGVTWQREDNAVQRRAADLEKAGLSKTLAAGSGAQASSPMTPITPQNNYQFKSALADAFQNYLSASRQMVDIDSVKAGILNAKADTEKKQAETASFKLDALLKNNELSLFDLKKTQIERENLIKQKQAAKTQAEKDLLQKQIDNYDVTLSHQKLVNDFQSMTNAQFLRDFNIAINQGVSSKDLGTQGLWNQLMKSAKGIGNKLDLAGIDFMLPGLNYNYMMKKGKNLNKENENEKKK